MRRRNNVNCPRDGSSLDQTRIHDVDVPICRTCGGMFLDRGELNRIAEPTEGDLEFSTVDLDSFEHDDEYGAIHCPRDRDVFMRKVEFLVETNIILDYCDRCHGFWMDGRELARINQEVSGLNRAAQEVSDPPLVRLSQFFWNLPFPR
jgi:Zn-finger nucleic acid-binding protein